MSPDAMDNSPLLELFREEVRTHAQALNENLLRYEADADTSLLEPMMRAAHSIKGAARIVNVEPAVPLAHAMEDCFVAAQQGKLTLSGDDIDVLLKGSDTLAQIGIEIGPDFDAWLSEHRSRIEEIVAKCRTLATGESTEPEPRSMAPVEEKPFVMAPYPIIEQESPPPPPPAKPSVPPTSGGSHEVVRVSAESLTRLMSLAGESLVEARWLQPFSSALHQLKNQQRLLADVLDRLWQSLPTTEEFQQFREWVAQSRQHLGGCQRSLSDRIGEFETHARQADDLNSRLYREVIASRMRPFSDGVQGFSRMVRDLARQLGKDVRFEIVGEYTEVDRDILEKLEAPLNHLLRNALDHGLETPSEREAKGKSAQGRLRLEAGHAAGRLSIRVSDDGKGIDTERLRQKVVERGLTNEEMADVLSEQELLEFLFLPGFSTTESVTEVSGRGVGLDVVHHTVHGVSGNISVQSRLGEGTSFHLQLPITLSVLRAVLVRIDGEPYAFPHNRIDRLLQLRRDEVTSLENRQYFTFDGRNIGMVLATQVFGFESTEANADSLHVVMFSDRGSEYGLIVDGFSGEQDLVVRPLDKRLGKVPNVSASALLDDGSPVLIVDVEDLARSIEQLLPGGRLLRTTTRAIGDENKKRILVVDDSITVREVQRQMLTGRGYAVETAVDGMDGWNVVRSGKFDLIISDIDMPRMNGLEMVRLIRQDHRWETTPIIIVSYKDRPEDRLRGMEVGANYYLTKSSFHDESLLEVVQDLIGSP